MQMIDYEPDLIAKSMRSLRTLVIAYVLADVMNPVYAEIFKAVDDRAQAVGYSVLLLNSDGDPMKENRLTRMLASRRVDGVIMSTADERGESSRPLTNRGIPIVLVDRDSPDFDAVLLDDYGGAMAAAEHLLQLGHRRIAVLAGPQSIRSGRDRLRGFMAGLDTAGVPHSAVQVTVGAFTIDFGDQATTDSLGQFGPTAVFASNNSILLGALAAIRRNGLLVPDDISLIGFDDSSVAQFHSPPVTVVARAWRDMGTRAVDLLLERMNHRQHPVRHELVPTTLIVRASCRPAQDRGSSDNHLAGQAAQASRSQG